MPSKPQEKNVGLLLKTHRNSVDLLKDAAVAGVPQVKGAKALKDGTVVDDLFYLRYVLSSKDELDSSEKVLNSKSLQHLYEAVKWRDENVNVLERFADDSYLSSVIPILKTGELDDGSPVLFLPVKKVDLDLITEKKSDPKFRSQFMEYLLKKRANVFNELDKKTRETGTLTKSVTVYDLHGISYSYIFKMKDFFELIKAQGKLMKMLFPQSTEVTVFVNSPGSFLLKSFMTSSKQKVMSSRDFIRKYKARDAVPDLIGGTFKWPKDHFFASGSSDINTVQEVVLTPCASFSSNVNEDEMSEGGVSKSSRHKHPNSRIVLTELEREMVLMKKNKLFSIDVLEKNQKVKLLFSNLRRKKAHILVVIKEKSKTYKNTAVLPPGFSNLSLNLSTRGEVLIVYLDSAKAARFKNSGEMSVDTMNLKKTTGKRILNFGKKKLRLGRKGAKKFHQKKNFDAMGLADVDKVLFRFEISDAVVCGSFGGETTVSEELMSDYIADKGSQKEGTEPKLVDHDARSLRTIDSTEMKKYGQPSFFKSAMQIFSKGW